MNDNKDVEVASGRVEGVNSQRNFAPIEESLLVNSPCSL
jgi:hypothetical protein